MEKDPLYPQKNATSKCKKDRSFYIYIYIIDNLLALQLKETHSILNPKWPLYIEPMIS